MYQVELVWNREFRFVRFGWAFDDLDEAIKYARSIENSGDGARVKKTRVVNELGNVVFAHGKKIAAPGGEDKK
jgi:hypothetical protein